MKRLFLLFTFVFCLFGCMADYDTFGTSDYHNFESISFEEQEDNTSVYSDEHKMTIPLKALPDSQTTWDSVTISEIDGSSLATLHLVESKFPEFPSDSAALDSLAKAVVYESKNLKVGSKIRLPASLQLHVVFVSEKGTPAIWQLSFSIPGVESTGVEEGGNSEISSSSENVESSSSTVLESSSSVVVLNSSTNFMVSFENQLKQNVVGDSAIIIKLVNGSVEKVEDAVLKNVTLAEGAAVDPDPKTISWAAEQSFKVTAEDGTTKTWYVTLAIADADEKASSDKELISISAEGEVEKAEIDAEAHTVLLHFATKADAKAATLQLKISETAIHNLDLKNVDLTSGKTFKITAEDGSDVEWSISADFAAVAPEILAMSIAGAKATIDGDHIHVDNLEFLTDLTQLAVTELTLSDGASANIKVDGKYDFAKPYMVTVSNSAGDEKKYTVQAGYQYPGSNFNSWIADDFGNKNDVAGWDNGNNDALSSTKTLASQAENGTVVKMESKDAKIFGIGRFASGNMLVAYFNPKKVSTLNLTKYDDGNELIDFGRPFKGRPKYVEFDVQYEGKGDSCDLYVLLENRTATENEGKNQYRKSTDVNTLVASAWYRATTVESTDDPDVVSITNAARSGYKTIRLALKYGTPDSKSPIYNSRTFTGTLLNSAGIDNHLVETTSPDDFEVTHIRVVMASSAQGNVYKGSVGATLYCDEIRLIY